MKRDNIKGHGCPPLPLTTTTTTTTTTTATAVLLTLPQCLCTRVNLLNAREEDEHITLTLRRVHLPSHLRSSNDKVTHGRIGVLNLHRKRAALKRDNTDFVEVLLVEKGWHARRRREGL